MSRDLTNFPPESLPGPLSPTDLVSPHFTARELYRSDIADRHGINNVIPDAAILANAVFLARKIFEPVRTAFGAFTPNSVFRCQALERALKKKPKSWSSTSAHTTGSAADIEVVGKSNFELASWFVANLDSWDQVILEMYDPGEGPNSGWVHVSAMQSGANRKQVLSYVRNPGGGYVYVQGLVNPAG